MSTCFWLIFFIHVLIKIDIYEIYPSTFICYYDTSGIYFQFISISSLVINIASFAVLFALSILTFKNVHQIRSIPRQQRRQFRSMTKKDFQLLRYLYVHDIACIILTIFPSVFPVYLAIRADPTEGSFQAVLETFFSTLSIFLHHISYCVSFYIFISVSKAFRQELKRMVYKMCGKNPILIEQEQGNPKQNNGNEPVGISGRVDVVSIVK